MLKPGLEQGEASEEPMVQNLRRHSLPGSWELQSRHLCHAENESLLSLNAVLKAPRLPHLCPGRNTEEKNPTSLYGI